jgi:hypothetical protein
MIDTRLIFNINGVERTAFASTLGGNSYPLSVGWGAVQSTASGETAM